MYPKSYKWGLTATLVCCLKQHPHDAPKHPNNIKPAGRGERRGISDFHITHNAFGFPHKILHKLLSSILKCI